MEISTTTKKFEMKVSSPCARNSEHKWTYQDNRARKASTIAFYCIICKKTAIIQAIPEIGENKISFKIFE